MTQPGGVICSNCHASNGVTSAFCSTCGSRLSVQSQPIEHRDNKNPVVNIGVLIGVVVSLIVVIGIIVWIANGGLYKDNRGGTSSASQPLASSSNSSLGTGSNIAVGTNITLDGSDYQADDIFVAVTEYYLDLYIETLQKNDVVGALQLTQNGLIFRAPNGTHGLLLEMNPPKAKIRIYGPPDLRNNWKYYGQAGWVLARMVRGG